MFLNFAGGKDFGSINLIPLHQMVLMSFWQWLGMFECSIFLRKSPQKFRFNRNKALGLYLSGHKKWDSTATFGCPVSMICSQQWFEAGLLLRYTFIVFSYAIWLPGEYNCCVFQDTADRLPIIFGLTRAALYRSHTKNN